jgi:hypothetical protein
MNSEKEIMAAVEERKKRARELGIADNVFKLYQDHLRNLGEKFAQEPEFLPASVTKYSTTTDNRVEFNLGEDRFTFSFERRFNFAPDSDDYSFGTLRLQSGERLLLELECLGEYKEYLGTVWKVRDITAFIEGPWVAEINHLAQQVFSLAEQRSAEYKRSLAQLKVEELKAKFGL